jgi:ATPase subunit of ABC transporter with duplicated ATPase domains
MIADISISEKSFGSKSLYKGLRLSVSAKEKIGLIGRNGVGKSTLFSILAGYDTDFTGDIAYRRGTVVVATRQEHHGFEDTPVSDYILGDLPEYKKLKTIIDELPLTMGDNIKKIHEYTEALERFDHLGYYHVEERILRDLAAFQIDDSLARGPLESLSGGQKRLVEVVKIMNSSAGVALIDEPTNHMDFVAKEKFIEWLKSANEAMVVITHDRDVLRSVDRMVEIRDGVAHSYRGNYDAYLRQNAVSTTAKVHEYEVLQRQIENAKDKVVQFRRLKEKARDPDTIRQFKMREQKAAKELEELQKVEKPSFWIDKESTENLNYKVEDSYHKYKAKNIRIHNLKRDKGTTRQLADVKQLVLGFEESLFQPLEFTLREGDRLELRGRNGAGKTTFLKTMLANFEGSKPEAKVFAGSLHTEQTAKVGVYEQEISSQYLPLPLGEAIERLYLDRRLSISQQKIMQLMSDYLFDPIGDARIALSQLSGGQKARFQLIAMLADSPQLLVLDEPTNHLDLPSIEELEGALKQYKGAILYVSHDSYFRDAIGGEVIEFAR